MHLDILRFRQCCLVEVALEFECLGENRVSNEIESKLEQSQTSCMRVSEYHLEDRDAFRMFCFESDDGEGIS